MGCLLFTFFLAFFVVFILNDVFRHSERMLASFYSLLLLFFFFASVHQMARCGSALQLYIFIVFCSVCVSMVCSHQYCTSTTPER